MPPLTIIAAGTVVGRLTVTEDRTRGGTPIRCRCSCGTLVDVAIERFGRTQSCGCLRRDLCVERSTHHGDAGTPAYEAWCQMKARCTNPDHPRWSDYGGRGITVCERWLDYVNFRADMGPRPPGMSLDRIDNDQGYSPDNCRWATRSTQSLNRRRHGYETRERTSTGQFA